MIVLVSERTDDVIREALPSDIAQGKLGRRIPEEDGYAYLAREYLDAWGNRLTVGLTDDEIDALP